MVIVNKLAEKLKRYNVNSVSKLNAEESPDAFFKKINPGADKGEQFLM